MRKKRILTGLGISILTMFFIISCNNVTGPGNMPENMEWTYDTLYYYTGDGQNIMNSISGHSTNDLVVCGHSHSVLNYTYRFDGKKWKQLDPPLLPFIGMYSIYAVYKNKTNNDIWFGGSKEILIQNPDRNFDHYTLFLKYSNGITEKYEMGNDGSINDIWGKNDNNLWATAHWGKYVYHFNGMVWRSVEVFDTLSENFMYNLNTIREYNNELYMLCTKIEKKSPKRIHSYYKYIKENNKWEKQDSFELGNGQFDYKWGTKKLELSGDGELYSVGDRVYKFENNKWVPMFGNFNFIDAIKAINSKSIWIGDNFGRVYYYNGTNWKELNLVKDKNICFKDIWANEKEVIMIGYISSGKKGFQQTVIIRGKLK